MDNWTVLMSFTFPHEAEMAKQYLESEGITVIIQNDVMASANINYSNAIGGVRLLVNEAETERAVELMKRSNMMSRDAGIYFKRVEKIKLQPGADRSLCPYCSSKNTVFMKKPGFLSVIFSVLFVMPASSHNFSYKCRDCNREWKFV